MSANYTMITKKDKEKIIGLAKDPDIYEKILQSIAPTIKGHRDVKEAIILQLFGGSHKTLENGEKLANEIKILIVGDTGIGKSTLLDYTAKLVDQVSYALIHANPRDLVKFIRRFSVR